MANFSDNERGQASAKLWLMNTYTKDLIEYANGDMNRFGRMVDGRGAATASPSQWLTSIAKFVADPAVKYFYGNEVTSIVERLNRAGFVLPGAEVKL